MADAYNQQLVKLRISRSLSLKDASKQIGIPFFLLYFYERGYFRPSKKNLAKIEAFYGKIDFSNNKEYPGEYVVNKKDDKPKKVKLIVLGIISLLSLISVITSGTIFYSSASNTESYYGETYTKVHKNVLEKGSIGRDILTNLEYYTINEYGINGHANIIFYKTNSILYFNNSTFSMTSGLDERPELGSGYYTYQFGGNLGKNSYICTFSYRNNDIGMFFSGDILYENKPIENAANINIITQGKIPVTSDLVVALFNSRINVALAAFDYLLNDSLGEEISFYNEFLRDREQGRVTNYNLQITGIITFVITFAILFVALSIIIFTLINLAKNKKNEENHEIKDEELPKDINMPVGIPDFITIWALRAIYFISFIMLLLGFMAQVISLPSIFTNETFLNIFRMGFYGGLIVKQMIVISSARRIKTIYFELAKHAFLYIGIASIETILLSFMSAWGYSFDSLIYNYVPGNIFLVIALNYLIYYFLFFTPSFLKEKAISYKIIWRLVSIIPLAMIVATILISHASDLFYGVDKNIYYLVFFPNSSAVLSATSVLFIYSLFFLKLFHEKKYKLDSDSRFFIGDKFTLFSNVLATFIIILAAVIDLLLKDQPVSYYLSLGTNTFVLILILFTLLSKHGFDNYIESSLNL